jgi:hypothetical protein
MLHVGRGERLVLIVLILGQHADRIHPAGDQIFDVPRGAIEELYEDILVLLGSTRIKALQRTQPAAHLLVEVDRRVK